MYAISLYRYGVCNYSGSRGFVLSGRLRDRWHCIFQRRFCFLGANYCNIFYDDCNSFGIWESFLLMMVSFLLSFLIGVGLGHGGENYSWPVTVVTIL